jgi:hypothetical protein
VNQGQPHPFEPQFLLRVLDGDPHGQPTGTLVLREADYEHSYER